MKEVSKKQSTRRKVVKATKERIENVEAEVVGKNDADITVPFEIATELNQRANLRRAQKNIRKQLCTYITSDFGRFVTSMQKIDEPAIHARLFVEVLKIIIPRPKEYEDENDEYKDKIMKRLFGKQEDKS